ncbi:MAG: Uma2 family endonuclease [Clostridia bacterium]|uniref:Uma2 family endonuclease n=1 Tax=Bianquea renquensis TaxID=2763661 RepID=A0A926DRY3_9FIRM|nr:Uma2 family endonuclease [Bianquea renquensis]MBC8542936.1 Uma2 family endonuclease [Bianquea renquensis]
MSLYETKKATLADWEALGEDVRVELIDGEIYYMAGPSATHQRILNFLQYTVYGYLKGKTCEVFSAPFDVYFQHQEEDTPNIVQPDLMVICDRNKITKKGCIGAPDWIIEVVSPSTAHRDYLTKLPLYAEHGVKEYWIVNPMNETITTYRLMEELTPAVYTFRDTIKVHTLADLRIDFTQLDLA